MFVMHFQNFNIEIITQCSRNLFHKVFKNIHTQRIIASLHDGGGFCSIENFCIPLRINACGANHVNFLQRSRVSNQS